MRKGRYPQSQDGCDNTVFPLLRGEDRALSAEFRRMKNVAEIAREGETVFLGMKTGGNNHDVGACRGTDGDEMMAVRIAAGLAVAV